MFFYVFTLLYTIVLGSVNGNLVEQPSTQTGQEKEDVFLGCSYKTSRSYACLYWYRQYPNSGLEFIVQAPGLSSYCSYRRELKDDRFKQTANSTSTVLAISRLELRDEATYYCALEEHTVRKCSIQLCKNIFRSEGSTTYGAICILMATSSALD